MPALAALADAFPAHERILAAPRSLAPLVALVPGAWRLVHAGPLHPLPSELARAAVAVNLHGRGPESHRMLLATRPERLIAFAHPDIPESKAGPRWDESEHEVIRWCRLLAAHGVAADPSRLEIAEPGASAPPEVVGATLIHPGVAKPACRWPVARFAAVARAELERGRSVLVTGGPDERGVAEEVAHGAGLGSDAVLAGRLDLASMAAAVGGAGRVVCADTGIAHLATALRTPSVVVFGPEPPTRWGPPADRPWHRALWVGPPSDPHAVEPAPALLAIGPEMVARALADLPEPVAQPVDLVASSSRRSVGSADAPLLAAAGRNPSR